MPNKGKVHRSVAFRHAGNVTHRPGASIEHFVVDYDNDKKRVDILASRTRDLLKIRFLLEGFTFNEKRNQLWQHNKDAQITLFLDSQHIAETIWEENDKAEIASRLYAPETRLVFKRTESTDAQSLSIAKLFELVREDANLCVSPRAKANLAKSLEAQLELLNPGVATPWESFDTKDHLLPSLASLIVPPSDAETSLELIGKMSLSPSEEARWDFGEATDVFNRKELRPQVPLHTIRLLNGAGAGLRALHTRRFDTPDEPHKGLVRRKDISIAEADSDLESLMALLPRHHRDLVALTSIPGLPALMALDPDAGPDAKAKAKGSTTDLPPSRVVRPDFQIEYINEQEKRHVLQEGNIGIALTEPYERAQISLTSQGATIDLRYAGEPPLLRLREDPYDSENPYEGFNVEASDYLTSLGMDWKVETADKGYLFPLGVRCSLVTLVSRRAEDARDPATGEVKRTSRANRIFILKMSGEAKEVNGPYCPFEGRWFPANSIRMRTLLSPPLWWKDGEDKNYIDQVPGKLALFWPRVIDPGTDTPTDFEFEWDTDDGTARSKLIFVLNEYVGDEHIMRTLVEKYNGELEARRMAHFPGTRHRYAPVDRRGDEPHTSGKPEDGRGKTSFDTQYWVMRATGRVGPVEGDKLPTHLDQQHFRMDGRMEGASQPPFYPRLEKARIRVQSADIMLGRMSGGIDVNYFPPYVIHGFRPPYENRAEDDGDESDGEVFLQTIGDGAAEIDGQNSKNRSGGVASFSAAVAAISRRVGVVGGQPLKNPGPEGARYEFCQAAKNKFNPEQFLATRTSSTAAAPGVAGTTSSFSLVLGSLDLSKLEPLALDHPSVPELQQQLELGPKIAEELEDAANAADKALYVTNGLAKQIAGKIKALQLGEELKAEELFGSYWQTLVRMGFTETSPDPCDFRKLLQGVADTTTAGFSGRAVKFAKMVEQFGDDTAAFVQNPVPRKIRETLIKIEAVLTATRNPKLWKEVWQQAFAEKAKAALRGAFCTSFDLNSDLAVLLFGKQLTCDELQNDPAAAFHGVEKRLYGGSLSMLGANMQRLFGLIGGLKLPVLEMPGHAAVEQAIRDAVFAIVDIVESGAPAPATSDIRDHTEQDQLAQKLHEEVKLAIETIMRNSNTSFDDLDALMNSLRQRHSRLERETDRIIISALAGIDDTKLPVKPEHKIEARNQLAKELHERLVKPWILQPVNDAIEKVEDELKKANEIHAKLVEAATEGLTELYDLSEMRKVVAQAGSIEQDVRAAIVELASTLLGTGQEQIAQLSKVRTTLTNWGNSPSLPWPDNDLWRDLIALIERIDRRPDAANPTDKGGLQLQLDAKRLQISQLATQVIDTPLLKAIGEAVQLRVQIVEVVLAMARRLATQEGKPAAAATVPQGLVPDLAALVQLYLPPANAVDYTTVEATIRKLENILTAAGGEADKLTKRVQDNIKALKHGASALHQDLTANTSATKLVELIKRVPALLALIDTRLVGDLAVFYSFPQALFDDFDTAAQAVLQELWHYSSGPIRKLLDLFKEVAQSVLKAFNAMNNDEFRKYAKFVLGEALSDTETKLKAFDASIDTTLKLLEVFNRDIKYLRDNYKNLTKPIADTLQELLDAIGKLRVQNGKQIVDNIMTTLLDDARRKLEEIARQLLPTKLLTNYTWVTSLTKVVEGLDGIEFSRTLKITDKEVIERFRGVAPTDIHMETKARFGMDMLSGKVTSDIRGRIAPIEVIVPSKSLHMATIKLDEITFSSVNGGKPDFHVTIKDVAMGEMLDFLKPLQEALAPGESGFYLLPTMRSVAVGYRYAMGEINLGAVRFLNLAFDISACLPFTDDKAYFRFQLSTPEWPFVVVSGPYGGGGYLDLSVYPDGQLRQMILMAFFGAVLQVKFGPIRASGRIVSGLYVEERKNTSSKEMRAFFEVSGRASVACFNLSLVFMVYLRQSGENLEGKATLEISVKRGFLKYTFSADATQRIKGRKRSQVAPLALDTQALAALPTNTVKLPDKMKDWQKYRRLFA